MHSPADSSAAESPQRLEAEHEVQFGLFGALADAIAEGRDRDQVGELLDQLVEYTSVHFMSEQLVMRLYAYPAYQAHLEEHDALMEQLENLRSRFRQGGDQDLSAMVESLRQWLRRHMTNHDRPWDRFLRRQQGLLG